MKWKRRSEYYHASFGRYMYTESHDDMVQRKNKAEMIEQIKN